jgi:hypothetical protein
MAMTDISGPWTANTNWSNELRDEAMDALAAMEAAALSLAFTRQSYSDIAIGDIAEIGNIDLTTLPTVAEVMADVQKITADAFPNAPSNDDIVKYKKHVWESTQMDTVQTTLMAYLANGGLPSTEMQDSIMAQNRERRLKVISDEVDMINAKTSARGFKYANGQTNAAILALFEKDQFDENTLNMKITELVAEWARQNFQFSIQQGIAIESAHMDFAYKYSSIFRDTYTTLLNAILDKYKSQIEMEIAKLDATVKAVMVRGEALKANANIAGIEGKLKLEKNQLEINQGLEKFKTFVQEAHQMGTIQVNATNARATVASNLAAAANNIAIDMRSTKG